MATVSIQNLSKNFGQVKALDSVTLEFQDGGLFALLGPSGSGKTTLLRTIAGFITPDTGSVLMGGESVEDIPVEKRDIGMMFQNYALFPNMSVANNVGFGLRVRKVGAKEEDRRVAQALELVQLEKLGKRMPHELSGGQQQRVALARAFVTNPQVLLLDEPLSALDKSLRQNMQMELKRIQREIGITTIFVTHDQEEALSLSDRIGILQNGKLVQTGLPREVYNSPCNQFVAGFLGEVNVFEGEFREGKFHLKDGTVLHIPEGLPSSHKFGVRPEHMVLSTMRPDGNSMNVVSGVLKQQTFTGAMTTFIVDCNGIELKVSVQDPDSSIPAENSRVFLSWSKSRFMPILPE